MNTSFVRAVGCVGICASLSGCAGSFGHGGGGGLASALIYPVAVVVASIASAAAKGDHTPTTTAPVKTSYTASYPDQEDPSMRTCDAKRREFVSVYGGARSLPPQLVCSAEGEFGAQRVYSSGTAASGIAEETADGTL